ncbi:MAG TPA: hypothetical protein VL769_01210 [Acidimicrobiia bacterium]|jgi:short-subunit dehydrogenase|nr:hypothetical protein [Acidimicrobiia bacterium]
MVTALITGASSGIGLELASELGNNARAVVADLSDPAGAAKPAAGVPDVDVLVNCAEQARARKEVAELCERGGLGVQATQRGDVVAIPGFRNKLLAASIRFSPRPVVRRLVHKTQEAK